MMKKHFNFLLMGALVCGLSLGVTSCKDDDDNNVITSVVTIDNELLTHGIETDMQSAVIEVPIKADGLWTATISEDADWCDILDWDVTFTGNKTLKLLIDENLTKAGRRCELTIGNGGKDYKTITIYQNYTYKGEDPSNGSGQAFSNKGVGTGINYNYLLDVKGKKNETRQFDPTMVHGVNNIFNISRIEELQEDEDLDASAYVEAPIPLDDLKAALLDSSVVQSKRVKVSIELGVQFAVINFTGKGTYNSKKDVKRAHIDYTIVRNAPMYNVYLSPAELTAYAADNSSLDLSKITKANQNIMQLIEMYKMANQGSNMQVNEEGLTEMQQKEINAMRAKIQYNWDHAGIFSKGFNKRYNELYNAISRKEMFGMDIDEKTANRVLSQLDTEYGPFYIAGGNFGGMLAIHARVDTFSMDGLTKFSGSLTGQALAGALSLSAAFTYTDEGYNAMHDINPDIHIIGGDAKGTSERLTGIVMSGNPNDFQQWRPALRNWVSSMESPNGQVSLEGQSQAAPISFIIQPIWELFDEPEIHDYAKNYFMEKYADRGIGGWLELMDGGVNPGADELLDSDSKFWEKYTKK